MSSVADITYNTTTAGGSSARVRAWWRAGHWPRSTVSRPCVENPCASRRICTSLTPIASGCAMP